MADFTFKILNGAAFERALKRLEPKKSEALINSALLSASKVVEKVVKTNAPVSDNGATGNVKYASRNHPAGTLRDSVKARLRKKVNVGLHAFLAGISAEKNQLQYYDAMVTSGHKTGKGRTSPNNFIKPAVESSEGVFISKLESKLMMKLTKAMQTQLNKI